MENNHSVVRYDPKLTSLMEKSLVDRGFVALKSVGEVEDFFEKNKDFIFVVNSVCGCAASSARPGVFRALEKSEKLRSLKKATVFAGVDLEATSRAREFFGEHEFSSPNIILFENGKMKFFMERKDIVHKSDEEIAEELLDNI